MSTRRAGSATVLWIGVVLSLHLGAVQAQSDALVHIRRGTALPLDSTRVAVKIAAGRVDALESSLRERGLAPSSAKPLPLGDWYLVPRDMAPDEQPAGSRRGVEAAVDAWSKIAGIAYASPVFLNRWNEPFLLTPECVVRFAPGVADAAAEAILSRSFPGADLERNWALMTRTYRLRVASRNGFDLLRGTVALEGLNEVEFAEPDAITTARPCLQPNDPLLASQWAPANLGLFAAWDQTLGSGSIGVVVIDDGVEILPGATHPDMVAVPAAFHADLTSNPPGSTFIGAPFGACDNHGTQVAGCIRARVNNGIGIAGVAPYSPLRSARAFIAGTPGSGCTAIFQESWVVNALVFAQTSNARVTNLSYALPASWSALAAKYAETRSENGIIHFAACGNDGSAGVTFPASLPDVLAVGALTQAGGLASYSNTGLEVDFVAPGDGLMSTDRSGAAGGAPGDYIGVSGTSFACAYAAGVAALVLSLAPTLSPDAVTQIMKATCVDKGAPGIDPQFGSGALHAAAALQAITSVVSPSLAASQVLTPGGNYAPNAHAGEALARLADIDGDGLGDLVIGSPDQRLGALSTAPRVGRIAVVSSVTGAIVWAVNGTHALLGPASGEPRLGAALANVGDVNLDGYDDIAAGAPDDDQGGLVDSGVVLIYSGANSGVIRALVDPAAAAYRRFGGSIAGIADVNADGVADIAVGAPGSPALAPALGGSVHLFSGLDGTLLWSHPTAAVGADQLGFVLAEGPDVNGDGRREILAGAPGRGNGTGAAEALSALNGALLWTATLSGSGGQGGYAIAAIGDRNGDGIDDIAVGQPGFDAVFGQVLDSGAVSIRSGASGTLLFQVLPVPQGSARFGAALARAADQTGDGQVDLLIGAPGAARAYIAYGDAPFSLSTRRVLQGEPGSRFGAALSTAADVNGDGFEEIAAGAPSGADQAGQIAAGRVDVLAGGLAFELFESAGSLVGNQGGEQFGWSVDFVGDVDGDGYDDLAIGAPEADLGGLDSGAVAVISGLNGAAIHVIPGLLPGDHYGYSVAGIEDLNGDGADDLIVGADLATVQGTPRGRVFVVSGLSGASLYVLDGPVPGGRFGHAVASVLDVDGDGLNDVVVGSPDENGSAGAVRVYSGASGALLDTYLGHGVAGDQFGFAVAGAGDVDGDLIGDIAVGAPQSPPFSNGAGYAQVIAGFDGSLITELLGPASGAQFGLSLSAGVDLDGDGFGDLVVGGPGDDTLANDAGMALSYSIATSTPISTTLGNFTGQQFGLTVESSKDVNLDGFGDYVVGEGSTDHRSTIFSGYTGSILVGFYGPSGANGFGHAVGVGGDANGDGVPDIIVGAYGDVFGGVGTGRAYVFSGPAAAGLGPAGAGNVTLPTQPGVTVNVLEVNGSTGGTLRRVGVRYGNPFTIAMNANVAGAPFALYGYLGVPTAENTTPLPYGIGSMVFPPCSLYPGTGGIFTFANNMFSDGCFPLTGSFPAPWAFASSGITIPVAFSFTLQPILYSPTLTPNYRIGNGIIVRFRP